MRVARLSLVDFRSHADTLVEPGPGFVLLTGPNGAGKTNMLEAVSLLAPGRGLRGAPLSDMARTNGAGGFAVAARLGDGVEIGIGASRGAPERRQLRVNGAAASVASLAERLAVLWLTPAMDRLFVEPASGRRRFLDRLTLALHPGHAAEVARYEAAMRERGRLLAEDERPDPAWLDALERRMTDHGAAIAAARRDTVDALGGAIASSVRDDAFPRAGLALAGDVSHDLAAALAASRGRDAAAGRALVGPHRVDLLVTHVDKAAPAALASTGEQKALLVAILIAHARLVSERRRAPPILLLDEVAAHLDPDRRAALIARLAEIGAQTWLTGTEPALFTALPDGATMLSIPLPPR